MDFNEINKQLKKLSTACSVSDARELVVSLVSPLGITESKPEELLIHPSIQREISRFVKAPGFRNQAAAYEIHHDSKLPIDLKLFWLHKTTKANLSWLVALTPNYEDNPENNPNANIGIDFVLSEECDRLFVILSKNLKLRVLELHESLSHTQREIFENWVTFANKLDKESDTYKEQLQQYLWKSFDFEPTNQKFYQELVTQFDHLVSHLKEKILEEEAKMFAVRFIGRTLFLWFLRKKEFINEDKNYFEVDGASDQTKYYRSKLEPLFFEVLNTEAKSRTFDDKVTPFLNGGLFEPIETDFYKNDTLTFPDGFFTQFYSLLNHYNFTVDEGTSEYEHVAVDPEMLGRVFENLLASINPNTAENARAANGAYYTHREIVDHMCEQSLIEYLKTKLPETTNRDRRVQELVTMNEPEFREQDHNKRRDWKKELGKEDIVKALDAIRVLDPAVGSGAFPMGMLTLLVKVYSRIDTTREKDLSKLKREILSQSLYGVDIDQMAIQISRLRAWLSMLVDMESLKKVEPLPNLDFKFVCANTLIPLDEGPNSLFDSDIDLKKKLIELRDQYYQATRKAEKNKIRKEYLKNIQTGNLFASEREKQLKDYDPFNSLNSSRFYDPSLMHGVEAFGVIIGNPPYILEDDNKAAFEHLHNHVCYQGKTDIWHLFTCTAISLATIGGIISFIAKNQWLESYSAEKMRAKMYTKTRIKWIINFGANLMFDNVGQQTMIFLLQRENNITTHSISYKKCLKSFSRDEIRSLVNYQESDDKIFCTTKEIPFDYDPKKNLTFSDFSLENLLDKIEKKSNFSIGENEIIQGIIGGPDKAFTFSPAELKLSDKITKKYLKPFHTKTDRFRTSDPEKYIAYVHKQNLDEETFTKMTALKAKLTPYKDKMLSRREVLNNRILWFHLWWPRDESFFSPGPKIVFAARTTTGNFTYTENSFYGSRNLFFIKTTRVDLKYITALLNSKLMHFYMHERIKHTGDLLQIDKNQFFKIPLFVPEHTDEYDTIVDKIIKDKKADYSADTSNLESRLDELVMDLYDLTEEEKEIIRKS